MPIYAARMFLAEFRVFSFHGDGAVERGFCMRRRLFTTMTVVLLCFLTRASRADSVAYYTVATFTSAGTATYINSTTIQTSSGAQVKIVSENHDSPNLLGENGEV